MEGTMCPTPERQSTAIPIGRAVNRLARRRPAALALGLAAILLWSPGALGQDTGGSHGGHADSPTEVARSAALLAVHERFAQTLVLRLGPFHFDAHDPAMQLSPAWIMGMPISGWLTSFQTRVLDGAGRPLPREILHHINLVRPDRRELFMPVMQRLVAGSQETDRIGLPFPFGVPIEEGDTILIVALLHNPTGQSLDVTVETTIHYDTEAWLDRMGVQPFYIDIQPPPDPASFDVPPGRSTFTWEGSPAVDVRVLGLGGHLHQFGQELRLEEVRSEGPARVLWRTHPTTTEEGKIRGVPRQTFLLRGGIPLSSDRRYRIVAVYDNPTGRTIPSGGMAEIGGIVRLAGEWPEPDRTNPLFIADYRVFTGHNAELGPPGGSKPEP
jgi:hypothetical protein